MLGVDTLGSRRAYANPWMEVREDTVRRTDGTTGVHWVLSTPDIALVIPVDGDRLHLVEQYRHPVGRRTWEFPSGTLDQRLDATAADVAVRELREETGLEAASMTPLGVLDVTPSTMTQRCSVFLASGTTPTPPRRDRDEQDMRSAWFTRTDLERMIGDGTLTDAKSLAAYALLLTRAPASAG
jgi:8-oxo-dGTP pyrophosphatase MutT (NUDIX family)